MKKYGVIETLLEEKKAYKEIRSRKELQWLDVNYSTEYREGTSVHLPRYPLDIYFDVLRKYNRLKTLGQWITFAMVSLAIIFLGFEASELYRSSHFNPEFLFMSGFVCNIVAVYLMFNLGEIRGHWQYFIAMTIEKEWKTYSFMKDVKSLVEWVSNNPDDNSFDSLIGNGMEMSSNNIPTHIISFCSRYVTDKTWSIKSGKVEAPATIHKAELNNMFYLGKKFKVIHPENKTLNDFYCEAEALMRKEETISAM